jgi:hypothetical protein
LGLVFEVEQQHNPTALGSHIRKRAKMDNMEAVDKDGQELATLDWEGGADHVEDLDREVAMCSHGVQVAAGFVAQLEVPSLSASIVSYPLHQRNCAR